MRVVGEMDWLELKKRLNEDNLVALEFWNAVWKHLPLFPTLLSSYFHKFERVFERGRVKITENTWRAQKLLIQASSTSLALK